MKAEEIEEIVKNLLKLKEEGKSKEEIDLLSEFNDFRTNNKLFYDTIIGGDFDGGIFKKMMSLKRKLDNGADSYEADVKFGKFMAEKYIDPVIKK
jgi:hypothetical protein